MLLQHEGVPWPYLRKYGLKPTFVESCLLLCLQLLSGGHEANVSGGIQE